jgi:hypothetical protein
MEDINVTLTVVELKEIVKTTLSESINKSLTKNREAIENSLDNYFKKGMFDNRTTDFENALDWVVESVFRDGMAKAMEELNFKELIASKAKEILSDGNFIKDLAEKKVRQSLGLSNL